MTVFCIAILLRLMASFLWRQFCVKLKLDRKKLCLKIMLSMFTHSFVRTSQLTRHAAFGRVTWKPWRTALVNSVSSMSMDGPTLLAGHGLRIVYMSYCQYFLRKLMDMGSLLGILLSYKRDPHVHHVGSPNKAHVDSSSSWEGRSHVG